MCQNKNRSDFGKNPEIGRNRIKVTPEINAASGGDEGA
jgi:hypothetical protein